MQEGGREGLADSRTPLLASFWSKWTDGVGMEREGWRRWMLRVEARRGPISLSDDRTRGKGLPHKCWLFCVVHRLPLLSSRPGSCSPSVPHPPFALLLPSVHRHPPLSFPSGRISFYLQNLKPPPTSSPRSRAYRATSSTTTPRFNCSTCRVGP